MEQFWRRVGTTLLHAEDGCWGEQRWCLLEGTSSTQGAWAQQELRQKEVITLSGSAGPPGWHGGWRQLPLLQGLAGLDVQS